jgi:hypothetical protein
MPHFIPKSDPSCNNHLCQVCENVSCGACCGLYNIAGLSRKKLVELLRQRTESFSNVPREMEAILEFGRKIESEISQGRPFPEFHHCPFVGFIGPMRERVGCMLHPEIPLNHKIDYRGLSDYGGLACHTYFCPSNRLLTPVIRRMILQSVDDWYLYGLVITEHRLLTHFFNRVEGRLERPLAEEDARGSERFSEAIREFLSLKSNWPYREPPDSTPCNYFFSDGAYRKPPVVYPDPQQPPSPFHNLFHELTSRFDSAESLRAAEESLSDLIDRIVCAID